MSEGPQAARELPEEIERRFDEVLDSRHSLSEETDRGCALAACRHCSADTREETVNAGVTEPETVLCVPGSWKDRSELVTRIADDSGRYLFAGRILMHVDTKEAFELQLEGPDARLVNAFHAAGRHWVSAEDLATIEVHTFVLYLIAPGGSRSRAEGAMAAAGALLQAGGLAVKVDNAGVAHSRGTWLDFVGKRYLFSAHKPFVVYVTGDQVRHAQPRLQGRHRPSERCRGPRRAPAHFHFLRLHGEPRHPGG